MDATSEQAKVIAALCRTTSAAAAQITEGYEFYQLNESFGLKQYAATEGVAVIELAAVKQDFTPRAWININAEGKIQINCGNFEYPDRGHHVDLQDMHKFLGKLKAYDKRAQYIRALIEIFASSAAQPAA